MSSPELVHNVVCGHVIVHSDQLMNYLKEWQYLYWCFLMRHQLNS